jgi:hypothetical protein
LIGISVVSCKCAGTARLEEFNRMLIFIGVDRKEGAGL